MCRFLTTAFALRSGESPTDLTRDRPPLDLWAVSNPTVQRHVFTTESYFRATRRHCDCDSAVGSRLKALERKERLKRDAEKRRGKGWSEQKIERWLRDKRAAVDRPEEERGELASLKAFLRHVASTRSSGVAILLHMYSGALDEPFDFESEQVDVEAVTDDWLGRLREDVLYRIKADR